MGVKFPPFLIMLIILFLLFVIQVVFVIRYENTFRHHRDHIECLNDILAEILLDALKMKDLEDGGNVKKESDRADKEESSEDQ